MIDILTWGVYSNRKEESIKNKWLSLAKMVLEKGADPNESNKEDDSPLVIAVRNQDYSSVELLIKFNVKVNAQDKEGDTAMLTVVTSGFDKDVYDFELVKLLLAHGADPNIKNNSGYSALENSRSIGGTNIVTVIGLFESFGKK